MLTDKERQAMDNAQYVRATYPVRFLQVRSCPDHPDNVQLRMRRGEWVTLHTKDAINFTRLARIGQRKLLKPVRTFPVVVDVDTAVQDLTESLLYNFDFNHSHEQTSAAEPLRPVRK